MKIVAAAFKRGDVKVRAETADDLWTLSQVINKGDSIRARTVRKIKLDSEKAQVIKKNVTLAIGVENVEWSSAATALRISGQVLIGEEDIPKGSYHTITIEPLDELVIEKRIWPGYQIQRLEDAVNSDSSKTIVCAFDREEATVALLKKYGHEVLAQLKGDMPKKRIQTQGGVNFFKVIGENLEQYAQRYKAQHIIVGSPSFWKDELLKVWKPSEQVKKILIMATCSSGDESAIAEILRRPETQTALAQERVAQEAALVDQIFEKISKNAHVAYGLVEVRRAVDSGAVKLLLITDKLLNTHREANSVHVIESVLMNAENMKAEVHIISSSHSAGSRLDGLGGIAATLRFSIS